MTSLERLRGATRDVHERLHHNPAFAPLMQAPPDTAGYARLLQGLHGFHAPVEAGLFSVARQVLPELDDLPDRRKAHLLTDDLAALAPFHPAATPPRSGISLPSDLTRSVVLGCLYVTEGATLGGRDLGRRLEPALQALGLSGRRGRAFFLAYEPHQGAMWRRFCAALEAAAATFSADEAATMLAAAREMFLTMEDWLTRSQAAAFSSA